MLKRVPQSYSEKPIPLNWMMFVLWMKISKTWLHKHACCLQDRPYNIWQSDIHLSFRKNSDFSLTYLQILSKQSTFPGPKDPCSKVRTFPGNKGPWEPCVTVYDMRYQPDGSFPIEWYWLVCCTLINNWLLWGMCVYGVNSNSSRSSDAYMRQWTVFSLIQVILAYCQKNPHAETKFQWNLKENTKHFLRNNTI